MYIRYPKIRISFNKDNSCLNNLNHVPKIYFALDSYNKIRFKTKMITKKLEILKIIVTF